MVTVRQLQRTCGFVRIVDSSILCFVLCISLSCIASASGQQLIARDLLIDDVRQLVSVLETAHPDPYLNGGGKIAFHERLRHVLSSIPEEGLTSADFLDLLRPLVASLDDSHTMLLSPGTGEGQSLPGLPLELKIIEQGLCVMGVYDRAQAHLLGARLVAVKDVPLPELLLRQSRDRGLENLYTKLAILSRTLRTSARDLSWLVPEWKDSTSICITFEYPSGKVADHTLALVAPSPDGLIRPETALRIPSTDSSDVVYGFLDSKLATALLVIANMIRYREGCEGWYSSGLSEAKAYTQRAYQHFHGDSMIPEDKDSLLAGINDGRAIPVAADGYVFGNNSSMREGRKTQSFCLEIRIPTQAGGATGFCGAIFSQEVTCYHQH